MNPQQQSQQSVCGCVIRQRDELNELSGWIWKPCEWHKKIMEAAVSFRSVSIEDNDYQYRIKKA